MESNPRSLPPIERKIFPFNYLQHHGFSGCEFSGCESRVIYYRRFHLVAGDCRSCRDDVDDGRRSHLSRYGIEAIWRSRHNGDYAMDGRVPP